MASTGVALRQYARPVLAMKGTPGLAAAAVTFDGLSCGVLPEEAARMELKVLLTVFTAVFVAELGDKTQLATMLFAADKDVSKLTVFIGASLALILASGIGVLAGSLLSQYVSERVLSYVAGTGFVVIGIWTLVRA
jgi:putative Ca2+/H+ antiporter (TMEM165/GDT1 family)